MADTLKESSITPTANVPRTKSIWAIGGGKGGIGKSFIGSSLAISLARIGHKVIIIDLDLGSANLHTCLGMNAPASSLSDFFSGRKPDLNALVMPSSLPKLQFIGGFNDALNVASIQPEQRLALLEAIQHQLDTDYIILDLGAGTHESTLDFFLASDQKITAVVPEPTSIENAYRFIKAAFYRKIRKEQESFGLQAVIDEAMDHKNKYNIRSPADLLHYLAKAQPGIGEHFATNIMSQFELQIIVNQVRTRGDAELGYSIASVCQKYFGIKVAYAGYLDYDNAVWQSLRQKRPLLQYAPHTPLMAQFFNITRHLVNPNSTRAVV